MPDLYVQTGELHGYAGVAAEMASQLTAAGAGTAVAGPALLGPVFGLIGGEFVAAFAAAHSAHVAAITDLASKVAGMGAASVASATDYDGADATTAGNVSSAGRTIEA
ncbi:type VII secretion target [Antrihabitans sp. YC2-6]|uniref:type VII secretion target n=1 Tax=Antrihabitans sp. YC2-6 TaxID=2799498 RepID=UPI0018F61299|nr:type VII secretion target [Antrihabitans sp. YC2-6]MBJ8347371.1 hypothetical protein [Antrihabitans sp. YC2-6]